MVEKFAPSLNLMRKIATAKSFSSVKKNLQRVKKIFQGDVASNEYYILLSV